MSYQSKTADVYKPSVTLSSPETTALASIRLRLLRCVEVSSLVFQIVLECVRPVRLQRKPDVTVGILQTWIIVVGHIASQLPSPVWYTIVSLWIWTSLVADDRFEFGRLNGSY